jgi:dolichol-phosphate mannosyltransferase
MEEIKMLSIVIPTYNEKENVTAIAARIGRVNGLGEYEIVFVDDSSDETPDYLKRLSQANKQVRYEHRVGISGLATAVVRGFAIAQGEVIAVMDADLQHPPELLPEMLGQIESGADIVIPSRFLTGGGDAGLNFFRKVISGTARNLGKILLRPLRKINDPTGGFFMFRKAIIVGADLQPIGWKILIEVLCKGKYRQVTEIPYHFESRVSGNSKMSFKEQWNYLCHLLRLVKDSPSDRRFYLFCLVGISGVLVNMLFFALFLKINLSTVWAGSLAATVAMVSNYILNKYFTWRDIKNDKTWLEFFKYVMTSIVGIGINVMVLSLLAHNLHFNQFLANIAGIGAAVVWNYIINNCWTWGDITTLKNIGIKRN